jgi:hypothetical protein
VITELEIFAAVKTLAGTEAGQDALRALTPWLENIGPTLDDHGRRAVFVLLLAVWKNSTPVAIDAMREAIGEPQLLNR